MTDQNGKVYLRDLARLGMVEIADGQQVYIKQTGGGTLLFLADLEELRGLMGSILLDYLWRVQHGFPLTPEAVMAAANVEPEADAEIVVNISRELADECER